ncbi:class F sortase [Pengzhenrongella phosphoraccumulans]|uniref:class F sortase n=1 Tax=Pengzhenrongella phosphoraccumulans TaxID=3114394 RepID=UPI00388CF90F
MGHLPDRPGSRPAGFGAVARCVVAVALVFGAAACAPTDPAPSVTTSRPLASSTPTPSATPSASPTPTPVEAPHLARSTPVHLVIPAIGVDTDLMALGLQADGTMEVPPEGFPAGWYTGAPTPGELGPAIIAGHVDWTGPGVFHDLRDLKADDEVSVTREDGSVAVFRVTGTDQFPKNAFPTDLVYGNIDHAGLRLITCGGAWNRRTHHYDDNLVVFADFVPPGS